MPLNSSLIHVMMLSHSLCLPHPPSVLARQWVKNLFSSLLSPSVYRHLHFLQSSLSLFLICYAWTPQTTPTLWDIQSPPLRLSLYGQTIVNHLTFVLTLNVYICE